MSTLKGKPSYIILNYRAIYYPQRIFHVWFELSSGIFLQQNPLHTSNRLPPNWAF